MMHGTIDRSQVTTAVSRQYPDVMLKGVSGPPNARVYQYLMRFDQGNVMATFTLNSAGKIAGIDLSG
jgi:hypothetical protein